MNTKMRFSALSAAGFLVLGASCASSSQEAKSSPSPYTRQAASAQKEAEQTLEQAQQSQKQATEATQQAAAAQAKVRQDQQQLAQDEAKARDAQAKAQQLQSDARQQAQEAHKQLQQEQQVAQRNLSTEMRQLANGRQVAEGVVTQARQDEVVIQPKQGRSISFRVTPQTQVQVEGRRSSASRVQEGTQARVAYEASTNGPRAVSIDVMPQSSGSQSSGSQNGESQGTGSSSGSSSDQSSSGQ